MTLPTNCVRIGRRAQRVPQYAPGVGLTNPNNGSKVSDIGWRGFVLGHGAFASDAEFGRTTHRTLRFRHLDNLAWHGRKHTRHSKSLAAQRLSAADVERMLQQESSVAP